MERVQGQLSMLNDGGGHPRHRRPPCHEYAAKHFLFIVMGPPCPMLIGERSELAFIRSVELFLDFYKILNLQDV